MLIAIMSEAYSETLEQSCVALKEQIALLSDWAWTLKVYQEVFNQKEKTNFMFAVAPVEQQETTMEDQLQEIKDQIESNRKTAKEEQEI